MYGVLHEVAMVAGEFLFGIQHSPDSHVVAPMPATWAMWKAESETGIFEQSWLTNWWLAMQNQVKM